MSNLVNETRLDYYTRQFWEKIKRDLTNGTFVNAQILPNGTTLQFTKKDGTTHDVDLSNFLRRNELTQNGGTNQQANMIPQLGADGKIDISMLPNIPFNNLHVVGTKNEIENMINIGTATAGDMFFVQDTNKVFIFANNQAPVFDDKIIEVGDKEGYVKTVNTIKPNPDGDVTVKSEHIEYVDNKQLNANTVQEAIDNLVDKVPTDVVSNVEYDGNKTLTVTKNNAPTQIDLSPLVGIKTIDQVAGDPDGNIEVSLRKDVDDLYLTVGGQDKAQIQLDYLKDTDLTKIGGDPQYANKIPQLDQDGKLSTTMIPDLAITSVNNVASTQEALNKVQDGSIQVGDVVVVAPNNEIYMYNGANGGTFGDNFIQLSLGDGTVKEVNGKKPAANGQVVVTSSDISYDKNISGLQSDTVKEAIDELSTKVKDGYSSSTYDPATGILTLIKENGTRDEHNFSTGLIKNVSYDVQTQMLNIETVNGQNLTADLTDLASESLNNVFTGDSNIFKELSLGLPSRANYTIHGGTYGQAVTKIKTGNRAITSHTNADSKGYVKNLVARVDNVAIGDKVNVNIWEVTKGQDRNGDIPKLLRSNIEVEVISSTGYFNAGFAIKCPINKKYDKETYFIYQVLQPSIFRATNINPTSNDYIRIDDNIDVTTKAIVDSRADLVGVYLLELGDVAIGDLLSSISSEAVTSVNNIKPVDGNVTVDAEHIEYNNQTSQLTATDVQSAIDELNGKFIEDVTYDETQNRTIFKTKGGQQDIAVVEGLVTRWKHLDHVTESNIFNIFNPTTFIDGRYYGVNGVVVPNTNWGHFNIPCSANETFTVFKKTYDSRNFGLLDSNVEWFQNLAQVSTTDGVWQKFTVNIPQDPRVVYLSIPVYKVDNNYRNEVMVFRGNVQAPAEFIPFTNNREISIDGEKVNISFDASTTALSTNNVVDAIKELDMKVINAGTGTVTSVNTIEPINGDVTITSSDIDYDNQTSGLTANKIQGAIDELKRDMDLIDSSEVRILADKTELDNLLGQGILSKGDIIYIIDSNGVIDYTGADVGNNGNPIAMIYDTDITVPPNNNHLRVFSRFNTPIHITATNVEYDDNNTQLQANNVQGAIEKLKEKVDTGVTSVEYDNNKTLTVVTGGARQEYDLTPLAGIQTINRESGIDGNVNLSIDNTTNNVEFKVDTYTFGTLNYMTDQQADNIINGWSL